MKPLFALKLFFAFCLISFVLIYQSEFFSDPLDKTQIESQNFDYYVFSLSWLPSYCHNKNYPEYSMGCSSTLSRGFVVHGLWPQREVAMPFLVFCMKNPLDVPSDLALGLLDIMPSIDLVQHEWDKHGTCSGLDTQAYFKKIRAAYRKISIPEELIKISSPVFSSSVSFSPQEVSDMFIKANPGLPSNGVGIYCINSVGNKPIKNIGDVLICMNKDLTFRSCTAKGIFCTSDEIAFPPVSLEHNTQ